MPPPSAENKQRRLWHPQPVVGWPKKSTDTSKNTAGITTTRMTRARLIFSSTRLVFERSIKAFAAFSFQQTPARMNVCKLIPTRRPAPITKRSGCYNPGRELDKARQMPTPALVSSVLRGSGPSQFYQFLPELRFELCFSSQDPQIGLLWAGDDRVLVGLLVQFKEFKDQ